MNSLNGLLKGTRYCLSTLVTTPYCKIINRLRRKCSPKKFSHGNSVNGAFASRADVRKEADTIWGSVNIMGCQREAEKVEKKKSFGNCMKELALP